MTREENLELVRRWFAGIAEDELETDLWHADCRIINAQGWVIETTYVGHDGLARWWQDLAEAFTDLRLELVEATAIDDDRVLTTQRFHGHFRTTGIELDARWASIFTVGDGLLVQAVGYMSKREAVEAVGADGAASGPAT